MRRLLLSFILICLLTIPASAHPGGTDSSGGHYDHSTGEYHYHHGYGPHEHEDLDGDGDLDCPYDFKDKTGENSGESSGSTTKYPAYTRPSAPPPTMPAPAVAEPEKESGFKTAWEVVKIVGILVIGFFVAAFVGMALSAPVVAIQLAVLFVRERFKKWWESNKHRFSNLPGWYRVTVFILGFVIASGLLALAAVWLTT